MEGKTSKQSTKLLGKRKKIAELLYRVSLSETFQKEVKSFRKYFGIPENGFKSESDKDTWEKMRDVSAKDPESPLNSLNFFKYYAGITLLAKVFKMPPTQTTSEIIEAYLLDNEIPASESAHDGSFLSIEEPQSNDIFHKKGLPFVQLEILEGASLTETIGYLKKNWKLISKLHQRQRAKDGLKNQRIRISNNKDRDEKIYKLSLRTKNELAKMLDERQPSKYKEMDIRKIMKGNYGIEVSDENIRKIISRQRGFKKGTFNKPQ